MSLILSQPEKEQIAKRFYRFLQAPYVNYYSLRTANRTGHELAAAMSVAKDLYHFREWLPDPLSDYNNVISACPNYGLLGDVTVVDKHYKQTKPNKHREPMLKSKDDIHEVDIVTWYRDDQGEYRNCQQAILLLLHAGPNKGMRIDLLAVMTDVINYWIDVLHKHGIIREDTHFPSVQVRHLSRDQTREPSFNLSNMYPHEVEIVHVVYNPNVNGILPIDPSVPRMTKYKIEWDLDGEEFTFKAQFEPEGADEGWSVKLEDSDGKNYDIAESPVTHKIGPY